MGKEHLDLFSSRHAHAPEGQGSQRQPPTALDLLARIQRHQAKIGDRSVKGVSTATSEQLELFDTLNLPEPA